MTYSNIPAQTILDFWFTEIDSKLWWEKDAAFDALISERFAQVHKQANRGELVDWRDTAQGRLVEIIVLDQFSRNMFRDTPRAFASDVLALILAQEAVRAGHHLDLPANMRGFMFLPFMHSESALMHERALALYTELGEPNQLDFEYKHKRIIDRFGRFPHRNAVLGRADRPGEEAAIAEGSHW